MAAQQCLATEPEYHTLTVTQLGWQVVRGEHTPRLSRPTVEKRRGDHARPAATVSWEGVDRGLFDELRQLRHQLAEAQKVPAYIVFGDAVLREMAARRPTTTAGFLDLRGIGERKCADYAEVFLGKIASYCLAHDLTTDVIPTEAR